MIRGFLLGAVLLSSACMSKNHPATATALEAAVEAACATHSGKDVCVAYRDLRTGRTLLRQGDLLLHAASTMKIAVMLEAFIQHDAGTIDLDRPLPVRNTFKSIVDGSTYSLDAAEDSEKDLYAEVGSGLPARELVRRMMVRSSNLATNLMVEIVGPDSVQKTLDGFGCQRMRVLRGVEDTPAFERGLNNVATARDLMILLQAIHEGKRVSASSRDAMLTILLAQEFNDMIPAGVPIGTPVAHKTGLITKIRHDAGIVLPKQSNPYVLVVLTRGFEDQNDAASVVARISKAVWTHVNEESP